MLIKVMRQPHCLRTMRARCKSKHHGDETSKSWTDTRKKVILSMTAYSYCTEVVSCSRMIR